MLYQTVRNSGPGAGLALTGFGGVTAIFAFFVTRSVRGAAGVTARISRVPRPPGLPPPIVGMAAAAWEMRRNLQRFAERDERRDDDR